MPEFEDDQHELLKDKFMGEDEHRSEFNEVVPIPPTGLNFSA
jgi:hypothetical protein